MKSSRYFAWTRTSERKYNRWLPLALGTLGQRLLLRRRQLREPEVAAATEAAAEAEAAVAEAETYEQEETCKKEETCEQEETCKQEEA